jgi:hypothetical protein
MDLMLLTEGSSPGDEHVVMMYGGALCCVIENRPTAVMHERFANELSKAQVEWVLAHEEGHFANGDADKVCATLATKEDIMSREICADRFAFLKTGMPLSGVKSIMDTSARVQKAWAAEFGHELTGQHSVMEITEERLTAYGE